MEIFQTELMQVCLFVVITIMAFALAIFLCDLPDAIKEFRSRKDINCDNNPGCKCHSCVKFAKPCEPSQQNDTTN